MTPGRPSCGALQARSLRPAEDRDIDQLMRWFPGERQVRTWGGPDFRYPFTRHSFVEDMHWGRMDSYSLCDAGGELVAFGQLYQRHGRINLARLVVDPGRRNAGIGRTLVRHLFDAARASFDCDDFSLFVYRDNAAALACYQRMGFQISEYPEGIPLAAQCYYLTRPVHEPLSANR